MTLKPDDVHALATAKHVLQTFNDLDAKMQVSTILTLIETAQAHVKDEKLSTNDIERLVGLQSGTATRNVYYWAHGHKDVTGGYQMIDIDFDPDDRRRRSLKLTHKGRTFIRRLVDRITLAS